MGKTTITEAALHHSRIIELFGSRRWFVRCEGATNRDTLLNEIASALSIEPGPVLESRVFGELAKGPALLVLDNAETPWEGDTIRTEELLSQISALPDLVLTASIRGEQRPLGPNWCEAIRIGPLAPTAAREVFLAVAGERYRQDSDLDWLLESVDRLPLAITLLAYQAEGELDLVGLRRRWLKESTGILRRADGSQRKTNLEVSLELSINSPRMNETALRLLSILGWLPDGIAQEDLPVLLPEGADAAAATLRKVGLVIPYETRLRVLAPVREYVRRRYSPQNLDFVCASDYFVSLALLGERVGTTGGGEVVRRLALEMGNLESIILRLLEQTEAVQAIRAALALSDLYRFTGIGPSHLLRLALETSRRLEQPELEARCHWQLGEIALGQCDSVSAESHYEAALKIFNQTGNEQAKANCLRGLSGVALSRIDLDGALSFCERAHSLFQQINDPLGEANCIRGMGDIALQQNDYERARNWFERAIPVYRRAEDVLGEANCVRQLGVVANGMEEYDVASARYLEALPLFESIGDLQGKALCLSGIGDIWFNQSDHEAARWHYEQALPLYGLVSYVIGEAGCLFNLGKIELKISNYQEAHGFFQQARLLYRKSANLLGEANCVRDLGALALVFSNQDEARGLFLEALDLYGRIPELGSIAWTHLLLASLAIGDPEEFGYHFNTAQEICEQIGHPEIMDVFSGVVTRSVSDVLETSREPSS